MSEPSSASIRSASFVTARSHISVSNSHSSQWPTTQLKPRALAAGEEIGNQNHALKSSRPSFGSATQIEPRVIAYEAALALEEAREAARLAAISAKAPTTEEIAALFTDALPDVQDARMIIASTHFPDDTSQNSSIIPLPYKATRRVTFAVIQQAQDVDLFLHLSLKDANTEFDTPISCQIIYDPGRDHCLLVNLAGPQLHLTEFNSSPALRASPPLRACIRENTSRLIQPGKWRISIDDDSKECGEYHVAEFWLRGRQFDITIQTAPRPKRGIDDGAEENVNKRQKRHNDLTGTTCIQPLNKTTMEPKPAAIATKRAKGHDLSPSSSVQKISVKAAVPLLELEDGDEAFIWALGGSTDISQSVSGAKGPASYELRRVEQKGATRSANVFTCEHSAVSGPVVAKVLQYNRDAPNKVRTSLHLWKTEKATLEKLKHRNVVALKAFDGRMLSMYLELLPESLDRIKLVEFSQSDIFRILLDISSALVYLKTMPIIHNDIKPSNITYSSQRGAVLIDFGLATIHSEINAGGTPWYLPPDLLDDTARGSPGDIWALGVTMLYLLGKIEYPEASGGGWDIHELDRKENKKHKNKMIGWLGHIFSARARLTPVYVGTGTSKLESIVFNMLERDSELRFEAEDIVSALDNSMSRLLLAA
ncbi:hypothetical protein TGAMA5MH_01667 [Trichoderma gamsii]|uniref:Protein kinase domain-containing protein n=1 Tax=Trichoderma gamsii TaxID=398673 RepID=A0A2K0TMG7_9HYPO|nr:hypothetical protein TGAMA5MH_01667 [Trichoderma gamsii]